jgi:hypothetical protein
MPGVGPVTATAIIATIGNGAAFRKGRDFAAWLGVVPEEHSTGGKQTLWKIPQRDPFRGRTEQSPTQRFEVINPCRGWDPIDLH